MKLMALRDFSNSVGTFAAGSVFSATHAYGSHLIAKGFAQIVSPTDGIVQNASRRFRVTHPRMKRIRAGSGLGDAIYLRSIVVRFLEQGHLLEVLSDYPDVFAGLPVKTNEFSRARIDIIAHYTSRKSQPSSTQFQDMCASALVAWPVPLHIDWETRNAGLLRDVRSLAGERKVMLMHGGRAPMARTDGFGAELLPRAEVMNLALEAVASRGNWFLVQVGQGKQVYPLRCDLDLQNQTSVTDLFDLAQFCDAVLSPCCFMVPLAESFSKKILAIWSAAGLSSMQSFISSVTPAKVLERRGVTSHFVVDAEKSETIREKVHAFCDF